MAFFGTVLLCCMLFVSLLTWLLCLFLHSRGHQGEPISPLKFACALLFPIFLAYNGKKSRKLSGSGAFAAMFIGWVICFINYTFFIALLTFYLIGSKATKFRIDRKAHERNVVAASARTWTHVVCNGFVAAQHALFYYLDAGCTESLIDFSKMYNSSWWAVGVLSATACCAGDTLASELGPVLPFSQPYLITSLSPVPKGTNGGVSLAGTVASAFGGLLVGAAFYMSVIVLAVGDQSVEQTMLSQWPIMVVCGVAGILGSLIDSFLGATLQYSGVAQDGCVVECPEPGVSYISGNAILDNHSVNFLSSLITSLLVPRFAVLLWSYSHV